VAAVVGRHRDLARLGVDLLDAAGHVAHADGGEQRAQFGRHSVRRSLVQARTDGQLGYRRHHGDGQFVRLAGHTGGAGGGDGGPQSGEAVAGDDDVLDHGGLLGGGSSMQGFWG
jgi:hypothetical protein